MAKPGTPMAGAVARAAPVRRLLPPSRERDSLSAAQLARRRWAVRLAKLLLPGLAVLLLAMIVLWPELERTEERSRIAFRRSVQQRAEALRVSAPRYQGVDELNRPFTVTATEAQQAGSEEILDLTEPRADILMTDGSWVYIQSETGRYDRPRDHLDLNGAVTIFHDNGTMMHTAEAAVDLGRGTAAGDRPVAAQGPFGTLTSDGFRLSERGAVVLFTGRARAVLEGGR
jgi:lipopolysaccharide export system protein LptC